MMTYSLDNAAGFSAICEVGGLLDQSDEFAKMRRFVPGKPLPMLDSPLQVRVHFNPRKPAPLPDLCVGNALCFASDHARGVLERAFPGEVEFAEVRVIGLGVDRGSRWSPEGLEASPFERIGGYHVLHWTRVPALLDLDRTTVLRESVGEMPELLPVGQVVRLAFEPGAVVPPLFVLPYPATMSLISEACVSALKRGKVKGFKANARFDIAEDFVFETPEPVAEADLVTLREALRMTGASGH